MTIPLGRTGLDSLRFMISVYESSANHYLILRALVDEIEKKPKGFARRKTDRKD